MPTEQEYVNYKDFVESLDEATPSADDKAVFNDANGPKGSVFSAIATFVLGLWASFIHGLTAVTSFVSGDEFPLVNGSTGKKMSKDALLQLTAQNARDFLQGFEGASSSYVYCELVNLSVGRKYCVTIKDPSWAKDNTGSGPNFIFAIQSVSGGTTTDLYYVIRGDSVAKNYTFTVPSGSEAIRIGGRANAGVNVYFDVFDVTEENKNLADCRVVYLGDTQSRQFASGSYGNATGAFFRVGTDIVDSTNIVTVRYNGANYSFDASYFVTNFGATLSSGYLEVKIGGNKKLVFSTEDFGLSIKNDSDVLMTDFVVCWATANAGMFGPLVDFANIFYSKYLINNQGLQIYTDANGEPSVYLEQKKGASGVYLKFVELAYVRVLPNKTYTMSSLASELSVSLVTSTDGVENCILIENAKVLCFDYFKRVFRIVDRSEAEKYLQLIAVAGGLVVGINTDVLGACYIMPKLRELENGADDGFIGKSDYIAKSTLLSASLAGCEKADIFYFFTDPHSFTKTTMTGDYADKFKSQMKEIVKWTKNLPLDFVLCGGDIVQSSQTKAVVISAMGLFNGALMANVGKPYYAMVGNHEYNTYGTGILTGNEIATTYLAGISKTNVYKVKTRNSEMIVMDTGDDTDDYGVDLSDAQKADLAKFANLLLGVESEHIYVAVHKLSTLTPQSVTDDGIIYYADMSLCAKAMMDMLVAYNTKTSVEVAGVTYDFTGATGTCEFIISGHCHKDAQGSYNGIPIILTKNFDTGNADVVVADFDALQVKTTRIGSGSDRTFNMTSYS